jgi:DNA-binding NtrC family response regulator
VSVLKINRKPNSPKGRTRSPRRNHPPAGGAGSSSLAAFARDLAVRINAGLSGRGGRSATRPELPRGRPLRSGASGGPLAAIADRILAMELKNPMEAMEIALLTQAMQATQGNITASGRLLGIHRKAVERHLAKHKILRARAGKRRK